jgi:tetratricopeptide (TPR) repeat protein
MKPDAALEFVFKHLLSVLGSRTLLVVAENLDAIFDGLGDAGQKQLRAFIQENPKLSIVATAQRLVEDLSNRASPFFGFFQTEHLKPLNVEEATELLQNIARLHEKSNVVEFLSTNRGRSRVRALHHLSGGNHRIYIVLSQFISRDSIDALLELFIKMVDELTPYYQERIRWLPPLQRKIVEYLCGCEGTVPVKEIAKRLFATPQTISSQLQDLREKGYVEANQRGRESLYEISEPLMRICVEVKDNQNHQPLRLLVDFLRVWYDDQELKFRLGKIEPSSASCPYLESALQRNRAEGNLRKLIILEELQSFLPEKMKPFERSGLLRELINQPETVLLAMKNWTEGNHVEAISCLDEAIARESTPTGKLNLLLSRAELHSELSDLGKEIEDYTSVIGLSGAPVEQVAKALVNRGITHGQAGETQSEIDDYTAVIGLPGAPIAQVAKALFYRGITHGKAGETQREIDDYTTLIGLSGAPVALVAEALISRGVTYGQAGEIQRALEDLTTAIGLSGAPVAQVALALYNRGFAYGLTGEMQRAIADYTTEIGLSGAPVEQLAEAFFNRGIAHGKAGETQREIEDYTTLIGLSGAPVEQVAKALYNRGFVYGQEGEMQRAIDDFTAVIGLSGPPVELVAMALVSRGIAHGKAGEMQCAIKDYTVVIGLSDAPVEQLAEAFFNRGIAHGKAGETQREIDDYTALIGLPGAPVEQLAMALVNRGITYDKAGETQREIDDYTAVINLPGAPVEQLAMALVNRGITYGKAGETQREIDDYTAVIGLPGAPVELVAKALVYRGITYHQAGETQCAIDDFTAVIGLSGAPIEQVVDSHQALAELHFSEGKWSEGFKELEAGLESGAKVQPPYYETATDLIDVVFSAGLSLEGRRDKVTDILRIYDKHQALPVLGEAVVQHIGQIFRTGEPFPSTDNLEGWASAWEQAAASVPGFRLSVRLLRTGINFVKAGGTDPGILLDLTSTERAILEQALGLAKEKDAKSM